MFLNTQKLIRGVTKRMEQADGSVADVQDVMS